MRICAFLVLLLLAAIATPAAPRAQDACLTGASTLGDQRALVALADATQVACPCEAAATRRAWQRCAKGTLEQTTETGELRRECGKTAKQTLRGTSCGGTSLPCGAVLAEGGDPTCRLARVKSCKDSRRADRTLCTADTSCADVVTWTAGTCDDPRRLGPYTPGVRVLAWTKDSAVSPGTPRRLDTVIWYPAPAGSGPIDGTYLAVRDAPVEQAAAPYPVVLFSHGSCGYATQSTFLTSVLASRGFIVVAPPHPGNTVAEFPDCRTATALANAFVERPRDMIFVLDQILAAGADTASPFLGVVDGTRVAMTGHSFGGLTTFLVTAQEPRITAAVAMAPATLANAAFSIPSLIALGNIDSVVNLPAARGAYAASSGPKMLVEVEHAGHYAFSDLCFPSPDCNPPTTLSQAEGHAGALRWVVPFLERYLKGEADAAPLLGPPAGPGYAYQADL